MFSICAEIPVIPDLEEEAEEDITKQVADAPKVASRKIQTMKELDSDIKYVVRSATDTGLNLSLLTKALSPPESVRLQAASASASA